MRSFLLELHCPHASLVQDVQSTSTFSSRLLLVGMYSACHHCQTVRIPEKIWSAKRRTNVPLSLSSLRFSPSLSPPSPDFLLSELLAARLLSLRTETEDSQSNLERQEVRSAIHTYTLDILPGFFLSLFPSLSLPYSHPLSSHGTAPQHSCQPDSHTQGLWTDKTSCTHHC